jgi:hypothetical protein
MFDPKLCEQYAEMLVRHDEVERALLVLDNIPAQYRDHIPENLVRLRAQIMAARCTTHAYFTEGLDLAPRPDTALETLHRTARGMLIEWEVRRYNEMGRSPHLVDLGPGEYFIPIALQKLGRSFTYWPIAADLRTAGQAAELIAPVLCKMPSPIEPRIFVALEVIEHLPYVDDIHTECLRHVGGFPEHIHLSTPRYTFDVVGPDREWRKPCGLPHLRAYTPREFSNEAQRLFPGYAWQLYEGKIASLRGSRTDIADSSVYVAQDVPAGAASARII